MSQLCLMTLVIHHLVAQTQNVKMESANAFLNIKEILTLVAAQSVFSTLTVHSTLLAFKISAKTHASTLVVVMQFATFLITFPCVVVHLVCPETHLFPATKLKVQYNDESNIANRYQTIR